MGRKSRAHGVDAGLSVAAPTCAPGTPAEAGGQPLPDPQDPSPAPEEGSEGDDNPMDDPAAALKGQMPTPRTF